MLKNLQSFNVRVSIVILLITISAYSINRVINFVMYKNIIGYGQVASLQKSLEFTSHPKLDETIAAMPTGLSELVSLLISETSSNNKAAERFITSRLVIIFASLSILIPILFAISIVINRWVTLPIRNLISATKQLAKGDFTTRAKPNKRYWDNYSLALADDFNVMASSLERLEKERQTMISDIAHELRTPITTMQLRLEAAQDGLDPLDIGLIDSLHNETELLSSLIVDLRTLSLAEAQQLSLDKQSFDLYALIENLMKRFTHLAQKKDISISIKGIKNTYLFADADRINQVLNNLMSNAVRHTPEGGKISIEFNTFTEGTNISVINSGSALAQQELEQIFNRFYRSGQARVRAEGGSGLGLAIVKALTELHNGTASVQNHGEDGIMFSIFLPQNYS